MVRGSRVVRGSRSDEWEWGFVSCCSVRNKTIGVSISNELCFFISLRNKHDILLNSKLESGEWSDAVFAR